MTDVKPETHMSDLHANLGALLKSFGAVGDFGHETTTGGMLHKLYQLHANHKVGVSQFKPVDVPDGKREIDGNIYMGDGRGGWTPIEMIKAQNLLQDEMVRKIVGYTLAASGQVSRLKEHTFDDISGFEALLAQEYETTIGGKKGNKTLMTVDGLYKVMVAVQDHIDFGPELQVAKTLTDECLNEWASDARPELRAIVTDAFSTEKTGQINRNQIYALLRLEIDDPRWQQAMKAIRDAMRVVGSKTYVRSYRRETIDGAWQAITVDLAKA
jgi:hypothetical protein